MLALDPVLKFKKGNVPYIIIAASVNNGIYRLSPPTSAVPDLDQAHRESVGNPCPFPPAPSRPRHDINWRSHKQGSTVENFNN